VAPHDFHDEGALVRVGSGDDGVNRLDDSVQRRVGADGHVRAAEIVVNGADHASNVQMTVLFTLFLGDFI
jgi:hypothetical protein